MSSIRPRPRAGLSLVEVLLAGAVLAVMALTLVTMFTASGRSSVAGVRQARAVWYAHTVLERIRARADQRAQASSGSLDDFELGVAPPEGYEAELETRAVGEGLDELTVRVTWSEGIRGRELTLSTLLSRRGARATWARDSEDDRPTYPVEEAR